MHEVLEGDIDTIVRPTLLFSHTNELKIPELANAKTNPPKKLQDNGAILPIGTQPSLPHSPLEDTPIALTNNPPLSQVEAGDATLQVHA